MLLSIGLGTATGAHLLLPGQVAPYLVGAIAVATAWVGTSAMHWMDGMASHRLGVAGEELTADEMRKLRRRGWRVVNHVMLERSDIDHALLGPGGFFAVDSKYRTDWSRATGELDALARSARSQSRALRSRLGVRTAEVRAIVVLWGPGRSDVFDDVFEHEGVLFCLGQALVPHMLELAPVVDASTVDRAFEQLDEYVALRDLGEAREHGDRARPVGEHIQDLLLATFLAGLTFLALTFAIRIPPTGVWTVALSVLIALANRSIRGTFPTSDRVQRATATVGAMSISFGMLIAVILMINLIWY